MAEPTRLTVGADIGPLALRVPVGSEIFDRIGVAFARSTLVEIDVAGGETARSRDRMVVAGIRPDEIWLIGTRARIRALWSSLSIHPVFEHVHAVDLAPGVSTFHLSGPHASSVLEKVCSLDWSEAMTPNGAVVSAGVARVACDIIRVDHYLAGSAPGYLIMCGRSYGRYLQECLMDAGDEFGLAVRSYSLPN